MNEYIYRLFEVHPRRTPAGVDPARGGRYSFPMRYPARSLPRLALDLLESKAGEASV